MSSEMFFRPAGAWVGDVVPWAEEGTAYLFYLHERRSWPATGMPWHLITTRDNVAFTDHGERLASGGRAASDWNIYTGSIVVDGSGTHHVFYTGQNPARLGDDGRPLQLVMHATSDDGMRTWNRHPEHTFGAPAEYESGDWRDPYVLWDDEAGLWRMLIAARHGSGPDRRRGTIAQCVSDDLQTWTPVAPFYDPRRYIAHECPEVFKIGEWWYLVYSEFSDAFVTRYRMARSLSGPWIAPDFDTLDGRAFYAAKSLELDGRRFFYGWIASREGDRDDGAWQWAGSLSVVEAIPRADGTLDFQVPRERLAAFDADLDVAVRGLEGARLVSPDSYSAIVGSTMLPADCHIHAELELEADAGEVGLLLRTSDDGDTGYVLRLEPRRQRVVFDRWPRATTGTEQWQISGDVPFLLELERPLRLEPGVHVIDIVLEGDICVVNIDGSVMLSTRIYDHTKGRLGFFVSDGTATLTHIAVKGRNRTNDGEVSEWRAELRGPAELAHSVPDPSGTSTQ